MEISIADYEINSDLLLAGKECKDGLNYDSASVAPSRVHCSLTLRSGSTLHRTLHST